MNDFSSRNVAPVGGDNGAGQNTGRVLVGIDGSAAGTKALAQGAQLARTLGVPLEAIAVWQAPKMGGLALGAQSRALAEHEAKHRVDVSASAVFGTSRPVWFHGYSAEGPTASVLIQQSRRASMLVVGSHVAGQGTTHSLGSVASTCAEYAYCPVLVVRVVSVPIHAPDLVAVP
ncbi:universal stress protein [Subtercola sp. PAMC28395]|uniref:universal stress protein n=1 Tax=Subtercola sp. PAMC28395 TaxID=2846775 RepID=UPI001C0DC16E|nr:universal stress protein [Subtercola sp. PAMC28395]QWT24510.1 universal stress protein [Subtercola sp. PAMC28395]